MVVDGGDLPRGEEVFFIDGRVYTLRRGQRRLARRRLPRVPGRRQEMKTAAGTARLDRMSVPEWLDSTEIGAAQPLRQADARRTRSPRTAATPDDQSALDLIVLLTGNSALLAPRRCRATTSATRSSAATTSSSRGMIRALAPGYGPARARAGRDPRARRPHDRAGVRRRRPERRDDGRPGRARAAVQHAARRRARSARACRATKRHVIRTMGMGTNAKIHLELSHKTWPALGYSGATYGEWQQLACGWDDTVQLGPDASPALYLAFPGGRVGRSRAHRPGARPGPGARRPLGAEPDRSRLPGHDRRLHRTRLRGPLGARPVGARRLLLLPGRAGQRATASSPAPPRAVSCSPASTPRSTTSASSTGQSKPANGPRADCSAGSAPDAISGRLEPSRARDVRLGV